MRALILAAGRGSRMGSLGDARPKCLIELAGKPLIARQVAALRNGGATTVGIVRGYRAEMIYCPTVKHFDNPRWPETNMVMSLAVADEWLLSEPVIVSYGDIFFRDEVVRGLAAADQDLVVAYDSEWRGLWSRRFIDPLVDAETFRVDGAGHLVEIGGKTVRISEIQGQYMGLLKFTPNAWKAVGAILAGLSAHARDQLDMTSLLRRLLRKNFVIGTYATSGNWGEVDGPTDLAIYESMIRNGEMVLDT
jgi:L-glutamine-phosphate cytidylyltransferase